MTTTGEVCDHARTSRMGETPFARPRARLGAC